MLPPSRCAVLVAAVLAAAPLSAQTKFMGMGDSIGEGVQSADANWRTQPKSYLNWIAAKLGVPFALPVIRTAPLATVGDTSRRSRIFPRFAGMNLAVSGADVDSILDDRADATTTDAIDSETDLVLFPRLGSQIEIVEAARPELVVCWIGNNDALSAVTDFDRLDASQLTSVERFDARFTELASRLEALGSAVVFINVPDVTAIAYLMDEADLERFLEVDFTLPDDSFTTAPAMLLLKLGLADASILDDPNFVLDASEVAAINQRIAAFNEIISARASAMNAPVLDVNALLRSFAEEPPVVFGVPLTRRFLGGLFSLDGVHPSDIAHAIVADQVIALWNEVSGSSIPRLTAADFARTLIQDPFWDKDGDGRVVGRPFFGLLETMAFLLGLSGDTNDFVADAAPASPAPLAGETGGVDLTRREEAIRALERIWKPGRR